MPDPDLPSPVTSAEPGDTSVPSIDLEALAEKIVTLLRREIELETERTGKFCSGG
jgi:hypothetical protein